MEIPNEDGAQVAKRQAIQTIMRDTSLTPQEKQKKIQEFMTSGGSTAAPPRAIEPPRASEPVRTVDPTTHVQPQQGQPGPSAQPATSKQALMQAVMRDASLTPQEKQKKIQEIMAGDTPSATPATEPPRAAEPPRDVDPTPQPQPPAQPATSKQALMQAVMRDASLTAQDKQKKIQEIMSGGTPSAAPATEPPRAAEPPRDVDPTPQSQPPARPATSKQALMQAVMRDASLTPQEKQKKIQEIMAGGAPSAAPAPEPPRAAEPPRATEPPRAAEPPRDVDPAPQSQLPAQQATSKQALMQAVMRDASLTPQEKQKKIQEIMAGGAQSAAPSEPPRPAEPPRDAGPTPFSQPQEVSNQAEPSVKPATSRQASMQAIMQNQSLTPQEKQKRIQEIMTSDPAPEPRRAVEPPFTAEPPSQPQQEDATSHTEGEGQGAKRQAIQAIMRVPSLTPQEKQKKIQELMASGGRTAEPPRAAETPSAAEPPPAAAQSQPQQEATSQAVGDSQDTKRQAIQVIMKDPSLTPQEKQKKIQQFMASGGSTAEPPRAAETPSAAEPHPATAQFQPQQEATSQAVDDSQDIKRQAIQVIMRDPSLTPQEKQKKIQEFMASGGSTAEPPRPADPPAPAPASAPASNSREAMQAVMRDSSLTPQEKQQRIQLIRASDTPASSSVPASASRAPAASAPGAVASHEYSQHGKSSGRSVQQSSRALAASQMNYVTEAGGGASAQSQAVGAVSSTGADPATRKGARTSRTTPVGSVPPAAAGRLDDPAARKVARASRTAAAASAAAAPPSRAQDPSLYNSGTAGTFTGEAEEINQIRSFESDVLDKTSSEPPSRRAPQAQDRTSGSDNFGPGGTSSGMPEVVEENPRSSDNFYAPRSAPPEELTPALSPQPAIQAQTYAGLNYANDIAGADTGGIQAYVADEGDNAVEAAAVVTEAEIDAEDRQKQTRYIRLIMTAFCLLLLAIVVPVVIVVPNKGGGGGGIVNITDAPSRAPSSTPTSSTFADLLQVLKIMYQNDEEYAKAFADSDTPQFRAASWAADEDPHGLSGSDPRMISRYALAAFYFVTNGDEWTRCGRQSTSCDEASEWLTAPNECDWHAIDCTDPDSGDFSVNQIHFVHSGNQQGNNIDGTLPFEIAFLSNLGRLVLSRQELKGSIPDWSRMSTLKEIFLGGNELTGTFPDFLIQKNQMLEMIYFENNKLTGPLPSSLSSTALKELSLHQNGLSGPIPAGISDLSGLKFLYLNDNELNGSIPEELFTLKDLLFLRLSNNTALNGTVSESIAHLSSLRDLDIVNTGLSGTLPSGLFDLIDLQKLKLSGCSFSGTVSESFVNLANINIIRLNNNTFTGTVPTAFELLPSLRELELHSNNLTGRVSNALCDKTGDGFFELQFLTADCLGDPPQVNCTCCNYCA